jgi:hypothetical protein
MKNTLPLAIAALLLTITGCEKADSAAPALAASTTTAPTAAAAAAGIPDCQSDVIVMERGSDAIRAMASNGMTWTINADLSIVKAASKRRNP